MLPILKDGTVKNQAIFKSFEAVSKRIPPHCKAAFECLKPLCEKLIAEKKKEGKNMKCKNYSDYLCFSFRIADEIIDFVADMEKITMSQEEYEKNFDDVQDKLMKDPDSIIYYLMTCDFPPMELIEEIEQFSNLQGQF